MFEEHRMKRALTTAALCTIITICSVAVLGTALGVWAFRDPVPTDRLARLQKGLTKAEVEDILGKPSKVHSSGHWTYTRPLVFGFVNIHWQSDGTYGGDYNYERF